MGTRIITKAELSRWANVSRMAATKIAAGQLADAVVDGKIDANHPLVREWLALHGCHELPPTSTPQHAKAAEPTAKPSRRPAAKPKAAEQPSAVATLPTQISGYAIEELEHLTVREVVMRYGSLDGFKRFVDSLKGIAEYKFRELKIQQQRGELVDRDRVAGTVFPLLDLAFARLVSDVPDALAHMIVARVESGGAETVMDVQKLIRDANSRVLKDAKASLNKTEALRGAAR
jgi:hypothetical protein